MAFQQLLKEAVKINSLVIYLWYTIKSYNVNFDFRKISHKQAVEKAETEYKKFIQNNLAPVEKAYLDNLKKLAKNLK